MTDNGADVHWEGGEVLFAGGTDWETIGKAINKKKPKKETGSPDLIEPHRLKGLVDVKIRCIAAGTSACHCIAIDVNGLCYAWGRNENGQLGQGDLENRSTPTVVEELSELEIVSGSCGKNHTAVTTQDGRSYTFGSNSMGQCGVGELKLKDNSNITSPIEALVSDCSKVTCGAEFTIWLCKGKLYAAGSPQYGVLGDGSTHEYNASENVVKIRFDPQPKPKFLKALEGRNITHVTTGSYHIMAVDSDGIPYTWGNGNYGRLGHSVQQHEMKPRPIESFLGRVRVDPKNIILAAGGMTTFCTAEGGMLYSWGNRKTHSDCEMYPRPLIDLQGWKIRDMSCGPGTFAIAAEKSVILWGQGTNGELASGVEGKRSRTNPDKCEGLEGMYTHQVACGNGFTMFLVDPKDPKLKKFPTFDPSERIAKEKSNSMHDKSNKKKRSKKENEAEHESTESENDVKAVPKRKRGTRANRKPSRGRKRASKKK